MHKLILIKHAHPEIITDLPANQWHLSERGKSSCSELAERLKPYEVQHIVTSQEFKALETGQLIAEILNVPKSSADNLHEHDRSNIRALDGQEQFEAKVKVFFEHPGELVYGLETANQAYERFQLAIDSVLGTYLGENLAVVTHGTVISLYVSRLYGAEPFLLWKKLTLPSFVVLDPTTKNLLAIETQ